MNTEQYAVISGYLRTEWDNQNPKLVSVKKHIVAEFYKPDKVEPALKSVEPKDYMLELDKEQYQKIVDLLKASPELLLKYLDKLVDIKGLYLEQIDYKAPKKSLKTLAKEYVVKDDDKCIYKVKNGWELRNELESNPIRLTTGYSLELPDNTPKKKISIRGLELNTDAKGDIASQLAKELDLEGMLLDTKGKPIDDKQLLNIFRLKDLVSLVFRDVLVGMLGSNKADPYPNIRGDMVGIAKPIIDITEQFGRIKENPEIMKTLDKEYRTEREQQSEGGIGLTIQPQLFEGILDNKGELGAWANVDEVIRTFNIAGTTALITCIRYLHDNHKGGDIELSELMTYNAKYKEQKETRRAIAKSDKTSFSNSLKILLGTKWAIITKEGKQNKTYTQKYYSLIKVSETEHDSKTGDIVAIKGLKYDDDFFEIKNSLFYVIAPKGLDYLTSPEAKTVALRVQSRFAKEQSKTVKGEPIIVTREWLVRGAYKLNKQTNNIVVRLLDDMVKHGLIAKWQNVKGTKVLSGYDKKTYKLMLYPTQEAQRSYITREQRVAERKANQVKQKMILQKLKKAVRQNTQNEIAEHLELEPSQLEFMLAGGLPIPEKLHSKIDNI